MSHSSSIAGTPRGGLLASGIFVLCMTAVSAADTNEPSPARRILDATGVRGGLVVHLGCGDGKLTAALRAGESYLVHGLDTDAENVDRARRHVQAAGLYGAVSIDRFDGRRLPYVDNLVNLIVAENRGTVTTDEIRRVLAPGGVAYIREDGGWTKTVKPAPEGLDQWTHHLYNATGIGTGNDTRVGPPRHIQWEAGPPFGRSHENMSSVSAMVSSGGRVFSIMDEGPKASIYLPSQWSLSARDAFSGVRLWTIPIRQWHARLFPLKSGPMQMPRRLVARGDRVYVTLGLYAPVSQIDAATGDVLRTFEDTTRAEELLLIDGRLVVVIDEGGDPVPFGGRLPASRPEFTAPEHTIRLAGERSIAVIDTQTGKTVWKKAQGSVLPLTIAADAGQIYFMRGGSLCSVDLNTGRKAWETTIVAKTPKVSTSGGPLVLVHGDTVYAAVAGTLHAFDTEDGRSLWTAPCATGGYRTQPSILVAAGLIWDVDVRTEPYRPNMAVLPGLKTTDVAPKPGDKAKRVFTGYDLRTGEIRKTIPLWGDQGVGVMHHRCHIPRASGKYLLTGFPGIEFIDTATGDIQAHGWIRGACLYGFMPANGLIYAPPHPCACYIQGKLSGFIAAAPETASRHRWRTLPSPSEKGAAGEGRSPLEKVGTKPPITPSPHDWPTLRGNAARDGRTAGPIPTDLGIAWKTSLGGKLTQSVIADGRVFLASVDTHTVHALDANTGTPLWSHTAGGRVDSPPTYYRGTVLFGSRDGYVYNLDARSGELLWRFRAAPDDQRIVSYDQVESVWPVHGSVLVVDDTVYFAAGRSSFVDDGIFVYRLEPASGKLLSRTRVCTLGEDGRQPPVLRLQMAAAMPDVLSSDGRHVFMRHFAFDLTGRPVEQNVDHLFCPTGLLDGSWFRRSYWLYGSVYVSGAQGWAKSGNIYPSGRILSIDDGRIYGFGRNYYPPSPGNQHQMYAAGEREILFASKKMNFTEAYDLVAGISPYDRRTAPRIEVGRGNAQAARKSHVEWSVPCDLQVRAMVLSGDSDDGKRLFFAGARGDWMTSPEAYHGDQGSVLVAVDASDGSQLAELPLSGTPVFDGMSAAAGCLFVSTTDGQVLCLGGEE